MNDPKVAVVILNWNGKAHLEKFLPSVYNSTYPNLSVVVADNASTDDSLDFVRSNYPKIRVLKNDKNYGYAGGYNEALKRVDADYFVLLNSDVEVAPGWIEPVIKLMASDPLIAAAQPKIRSWAYRDKFEYAGAAGGYIDRYAYPFCRGRIFDTLESDLGQYDDTSEIFWASGAALFIKSDRWREIGGLDTAFFAHMEEIDLCWRLKNKGYKVMYCPGSTVYHVGGGTLEATNPQKTYLNFRNSLTMIQKNLPAGAAFRILFIRFWLDFIALLRFLFTGNFAHARAINKAHTAFILSLGKKKKKSHVTFSKSNNTGMYKGSIVWAYFVRGKKYFKDL